MDLDVGTIIDGRYEVLSRLGEGGMAVVYRVRHQQLGSEHALKVLSLNARSVQQRMLQEGRLQARLRHPNIVGVTDVILVKESPALVMELVDGPPLDELIRAQKLTLDQADAIGRGILAAVAHAHRQGMIHRDLKPANVLLEIIGQTARPKVTDFGLAKLLDGSDAAATRTGATMGTPQYMSPEQIKDAKNVDGRADVFALGAMLYELLTGQRSFDGDNIFEIFQAIDAGVYIPVEALRPDAPAHMIAAVQGALQTDKEVRTPTVEALYEAWTDGEPLPDDPIQTASSLAPFPSLPPTGPASVLAPVPATASAPPATGMFPAVVVGGGMVVFGGAVVLAAVLVVGGLWWWSGPQIQFVDRPVLIDVTDRPVAPTAGPSPTETPVPTDAIDTDSPLDTDGMGVPWSELELDENGQPRVPEPVSVAPMATPPSAPVVRTPAPVVPLPPLADADLVAEAVSKRSPPILFTTLLRRWDDNTVRFSDSDLAGLLKRAEKLDRVPELLGIYGRRGTSLGPLRPYLSTSPGTRRAATQALVEVALRTDQRDQARKLVQLNQPSIPPDAYRAALKTLAEQ